MAIHSSKIGRPIPPNSGATVPPNSEILTILLENIRLENPLNGNKGGHWASRAKRAKSERTFTRIMVLSKIYGQNLNAPLVVTITRLSSGTLDDDSLPASAKHIRDGIADALGIKDNDPRITWKYLAEKVKRGTWGVRIAIASSCSGI